MVAALVLCSERQAQDFLGTVGGLLLRKGQVRTMGSHRKHGKGHGSQGRELGAGSELPRRPGGGSEAAGVQMERVDCGELDLS